MSTEKDPREAAESRDEARAALYRNLDSLQEVLAQEDEVVRVTRSLRQIRQGDAFALDLEQAMRGRRGA